MYKVDKNIVTYRIYQGEDIDLPFRSKISDIQYRNLNDYTIQVWCAAQEYDYTPGFDFYVKIDETDPYLGYIQVVGDQTWDTRENKAFVRVYGIDKLDNKRIMLFAGLIEILA